MLRRAFGVLVITILILSAGAQPPDNTSEPMLVGPGVTAPRLLRKTEPEFPPEARANHVEGTVVLQIVIDEKGKVADIDVVSALGGGLDEQAQAAVAKWEFAPGMKAGSPVKILATVEVNFNFAGTGFDHKAEQERTAYNVALSTLKRGNVTPPAVDRAVQSMMDLSGRKFPPAMYIAGLWKISGEHGPKDVTGGLDLVEKAAAKNYSPALYEMALRRIQGRDLTANVEQGMREMGRAATLGSQSAQFYLGHRYETGDGVPREPERARRYFRLCAAQGVALCQYRLGRFLYDAPERRERDYLEAVALFQLAADRNMPEAAQIAVDEAQKLTLEQSKWVANLKRQVVRK